MADQMPSYCPTFVENLSGKDILPRVLNKNQIDQIFQNLREQISKSIKDMRVLSTEASSESSHAQSAGLTSLLSPQEVYAALVENPKKKGRKTTTKVLRKFTVSYEVPHICFEENIDLDNSILYDESGSNSNKRYQFSFIQRLQNWTLQQRERSTKMRDIYYNHMLSGSTFRSMKEVVNFMIFEKYPTKPSHEKHKKPEVGEGSEASNESFGTEKQKGDEEIDKLALQKEKVEKFMYESYENLMNWQPECDD